MTVGSVVLGVILARVTLWFMGRIEDVWTAVIVQFCGMFGVWLLAERLHLSGILTMVVFARRPPAARATSSPRASACRRTRCGKSRCSC